ncbi:MAG TPA: LysE family transporter [bacterium]|nr:LysE family transporter [bacterium]
MNYLISIFAMSFTIALAGALAPGPLLTAVVAKSPKYGFKTGPLLMIGHAVAEILMIAVIVSGFSRFMENPLLIKMIALLGGIILIFFGLGMIRKTPSLSTETATSKNGVSNLPFLGMTVSMSNPYWTIWWFTIGLGLVLAAQKAGFLALLVFFLGHILADIGWYSIVSFAVSRGRKFISDRIYRGIMKTCGAILTGFGIYFISGFFKNSI